VLDPVQVKSSQQTLVSGQRGVWYLPLALGSQARLMSLVNGSVSQRTLQGHWAGVCDGLCTVFCITE
jgi:hypothetical protein